MYRIDFRLRTGKICLQLQKNFPEARLNHASGKSPSWNRRKPKPMASTPPHFCRSGVDGSRTRVQKPIPCPSTIIVCCSAVRALCGPQFHHRPANRLPNRISSFMIRPCGQSLPHVVSHIVDARAPKCGGPGPDKPPEATSFTAY